MGLDRIMAVFHEVGGGGLVHFKSLSFSCSSCQHNPSSPRKRGSSIPEQQ
jgi:hypothetical protein